MVHGGIDVAGIEGGHEVLNLPLDIVSLRGSLIDAHARGDETDAAAAAHAEDRPGRQNPHPRPPAARRWRLNRRLKWIGTDGCGLNGRSRHWGGSWSNLQPRPGSSVGWYLSALVARASGRTTLGPRWRVGLVSRRR